MKRYLYVFTIEMNWESLPKRTKKRILRLNPTASEAENCLYVGFWKATSPRKVFPNNDFRSAKSKLVRKYGKKVKRPHLSRHTQLEGALSKRDKVVSQLRSKGKIVANSPPRRSYSVYVLELDPEIGSMPGVEKKNPDADPAKPVVYVGQTAKSPRERLEEHRKGIRSGRYFKGDQVIRLLPELYTDLPKMTHLESLRQERALAQRLRKQGYTVLGGH